MRHPSGKPDILLRILLVLSLLLLLAVLLVCFWRRGQEPPGPPLEPLDLQGQVWVSYGDSITDGAFWQAPVAETFGLVHLDQGIGGTTLAGFGPLAFWREERLEQIIEAQPTLITIMGGTNDFFSDFYLGTPDQFDLPLAEKQMDNFLGAYSYLIERLQASLPDSRIVLLTTPINASFFSDQPLNGRGNSIRDFANATALVADHYNLVLVDMRDLYTNEADFQADFWDGIHPNLDGSAKIAEALSARLADIAK